MIINQQDKEKKQMERIVNSDFKLGVITGGQLGKMLIQEATKWDIVTYVLDNDAGCPAGNIANHFVKGDYRDFQAVYDFGKQVDLLTFEIENVNIEALQKLKTEGIKVVPDPDILEIIQDKGLQKNFYANNNISTSLYRLFDSQSEILESVAQGKIKFPFVQKLRKGGYDGRGVSVINDENDLDKLLLGPSIIEEKIQIDKEIAVIIARNKNGEIRCYPVVEMLFDHHANLVDKLICPASITPKQAETALNLARKIMELLNMEGLLAVELFVDKQGQVFVNEVAPRPHNSGHHTIESVITSQFEQHLRAVFNFPLGSTQIKLPSVMINILGEPGYEGPAHYEGLMKSLAIEGVKIHLYGKKITKPYRKMGHVTVLASTLESALAKAQTVKNLIKVKS